MNSILSQCNTFSISERIDASGKTAEFNDAVADRDLETVILILVSIDMDPEQIPSVLNDLGFFR